MNGKCPAIALKIQYKINRITSEEVSHMHVWMRIYKLFPFPCQQNLCSLGTHDFTEQDNTDCLTGFAVYCKRTDPLQCHDASCGTEAVLII